MSIKLSDIQWTRILKASVVASVLSIGLVIMVITIYAIGLGFVTRAAPDQARIGHFADRVGTWGMPVLAVLLAVGAAVWAVQKIETGPSMHGLLVGLVIAALNLIIALAFGSVFNVVLLAELALMVGAGWLGGALGSRAANTDIVASTDAPRATEKAKEAAQLLATLPAFGLVVLFVPVALTNIFCRATGICAGSPYSPFMVYALANWVGIGLLALLLRWRQVPLSALGWRFPRLSDLLWALVAFFVGGGLYQLARVINRLLGTPMQGMDFGISGAGALMTLLFANVVTVPLVEETLFRGYGLGYLRARGLSPVLAGLLSLLAFAAIHLPHFGVGGAVFIALWGILPTVLRLWRGNLAPGWLMHVFNNLFAYILVPLLFAS